LNLQLVIEKQTNHPEIPVFAKTPSQRNELVAQNELFVHTDVHDHLPTIQMHNQTEEEAKKADPKLLEEKPAE